MVAKAPLANTRESTDKELALRLTPVSRETRERLEAYVKLLQVWQAKTNLVAPSTLPQLWTRHIADSLQLLAIAPGAKRWLDLGSGGGLPGIVLASALAEQGEAHVDLVERNGKKVAFLREVIRICHLPAAVHDSSIEDYVDSVAAVPECVTARAVAPLQMLVTWSAPLLQRGSKGLFHKGQDVAAELTETARYWNMDYRLHSSQTGNGEIVEVLAAVQHGSGVR